MQYRLLGKTDIKVSTICLGTMTFGQQNSETDAHEQLNYAVEQGVNFIDTAEMYAVPSTPQNNGLTEKYIGTWLKQRTDRDKLVIATKITGPSENLKHIRYPLSFNKKQIHTALEASLKRLQTDYVDLYQLHWPERKTNYFGQRGYTHDPAWQDNILEVLQVLDGLVKAGKIRNFGLSNETPWGLMRFLQESQTHNLARCASIQNPYSLLNRLFEVGLSEIAIREKTGLLAYSPMGFGLLSGKYHGNNKPTNGRLSLFPRMARYSSENSYKATEAYLAIAADNGLSAAQLALAFVNTRPFVTSNIIGATTMAQLKENIASIEVTLSSELLAAIETVHAQYPNTAP